MKEKLTLNWTHTLIYNDSSLPHKKTNPKKYNNCFWQLLGFGGLHKKCLPPILILRGIFFFFFSKSKYFYIWYNYIFSIYNWLQEVYNVLAIYIQEIGPKTWKSYRIFGFMIFLLLFRHETSISEATKLVFWLD